MIEFVVSGTNVYLDFLSESGGHRVQRIPPTEKHGRRQTSTVTVAVLPVVGINEVKIKDEDLYWDTFRAGGKGGQNVNKVETAVRVKHIPSGMVVCCQDERQQNQNKRKALEILCSRLYVKMMQENTDKENQERKKQIGSGQRGDKIRTYRFQDNIVINHLIGNKVRLEDVLNGDLDSLKGCK